MDVLDSALLAVIEGVTEFLPISSTGHLIVASEFMGLKQTNVNKAYEVIIQFAAILAVILNYPSKFTFQHVSLWTKVFIAFLPIAAIGFIFSDQVKAMFSIEIVAWMFIIGGVIFLIVEKFYIETEKHTSDVEDVSYKQSLYIGIAQIFALIPGTSRAGSSIIGGMLAGLSRKASTEFSFLLAFPVMCATTAYDILKHYNELLHPDNIMNLAVGFVISFIVAFLTIKLFLKFLENFTFVAFGIYRIIFGVFLLSVF